MRRRPSPRANLCSCFQDWGTVSIQSSLEANIARANKAGIGATSTTEDVLSGVNVRDKRILVTGVSAGLGVETARSLAAHGAQVAGAAREIIISGTLPNCWLFVEVILVL